MGDYNGDEEGWSPMVRDAMIHSARASLVASVAVAATALDAHAVPAYIDPGIGSYILQILVGAVAGALFVSKLYWQKVKSFVQGLFGTADAAESADERSEHSSSSETTS